VSWALVLALAVGSYGFKALGLVVLGGRDLPPRLMRCVALLPAAVLPALIVVGTFGGDRELVLDARAVGLAVATPLAIWKAPFPVVIGAAALATALVRALA